MANIDPATPIALKKTSEPKQLRPPQRTFSKLEREKARLKKATHEFESFFMSSMLKSMRQTIPRSEESGAPGDAGLGKDIFQSMFDDELAKKMAEGSQGGLGDILYQNLVKRVEAQYASSGPEQALKRAGASPALKEVKQVPTQE